MDGGRVLRALLAMRMDRARATRLAARVGRAIAVAFAVASLFWNPMLAIIAVFVWLSGQQESAAVTLRATLRGVPSERVMVTRFTSLSPAESLSSAAERVIAGSQHDFPVVEDGRVVGVLTRGDLLRGLAAEGAPLTVGQAMSRGFTVADSADTLDGILDHAPRSGEGPIVVVRDDRLLGMITPESLEDFVALETARRHGVR
jgi:CBS domain-containing protein